MTLDPEIEIAKGLFINKPMNTLITLKQEIDCSNKVCPKSFAPLLFL